MLNTSNSSAMDYISDFIDDEDDDYDYSNYSQGNLTNASDYDLSSYWCMADAEQEFIIKTFQTCVFCLIFPLGFMGNGLVMATYAHYRRFHHRSMTDIFLFNLAMADLLLLLTLPLQAVYTHLGWIFPIFLCKAMRACYAINTYSGLLLLACISVDRYMVVAWAQDVLRLRSKILRGGKVAAGGVWIAAGLLSLPEIIYSGVLGSEGDYYCGMINSGGVKMATNGTIIAVFCLSFFVMVTCYSLIAHVLWEGHAHRRGKQWPRQRTLKLMVALVLVFLVFQLPYTVVLSQKMSGQFCGLLLEYITCTLAYTRCCLNPVLYALVGVRFRKDVMRLLQDTCCRCGFQLVPQTVSSTSMSPSLPVLTVCSPTSPERSYQSDDKFHFPGSK
ncbi:C-C chemokine receptor type 10 isoform X1 [Xyrichtys novacula]|uniref:C-C chemokine receptor type 10 isoform X1 n=1 Tax=Xyrichtys novacula TaxID=13765 RepID=A0AAV1H803_XYRNO|nr:C-C chemokine receptor type 10 isoform X1 [Xyrichtys novacula]